MSPTPAASADSVADISAASVLPVALIALMVGVQPVLTDLYLASLPKLAAELGSSAGSAQITLSAMLLAFGLSQLVWGAVSDCWGRRRVMLCALGLVIASSLWAATVQSFDAFVWARILQGLGSGGVVVGVRAAVRDLYPPHLGAGVMAKALSGLALIAASAVQLGAWLAAEFGWRGAMLAVAAYGAVTLVVLLRCYRESLQPDFVQRISWRNLVQAYSGIVRSRVFWSYSLVVTASFTALFAFLGASPFVLMEQYGFSFAQYGWTMLAMSCFYFGGTQLCRWCLKRWSIPHVLRIATVFTAFSVVGVLCTATGSAASPWVLIGSFNVLMVAHGMNQPCTQYGVTLPFAHAAGKATALSGVVMMVGAYLMGLLLAFGLQSSNWLPSQTLAVCIALGGSLSVAFAWGLLRDAAAT